MTWTRNPRSSPPLLFGLHIHPPGSYHLHHGPNDWSWTWCYPQKSPTSWPPSTDQRDSQLHAMLQHSFGEVKKQLEALNQRYEELRKFQEQSHGVLQEHERMIKLESTEFLKKVAERM